MNAFAHLQIPIFFDTLKVETNIFPVFFNLLRFYNSTFIEKKNQKIDNYKTHTEMVCFAMLQYSILNQIT